MMPRFYSAGVTTLDQSHDDTNEEEHLSLLHACEVETLVSQKTQRELQTREQEEVAEINQAQHLKLLHSLF